jgi:hypothetical protein
MCQTNKLNKNKEDDRLHLKEFRAMKSSRIASETKITTFCEGDCKNTRNIIL